MFLWSKMMLDYLKNARSQNIQLQEIPTGLTEVSERLVCEATSSLDKGEFGRRLNIFRILVGASRPLTLEEVSVLLALRCLSGFVDDRGLFLDPKGEILRSCWPLVVVVVVDEFVQLIPISFKDLMNQSPIEIEAARMSGLRTSQDQYKAPRPEASLLRKSLKFQFRSCKKCWRNIREVHLQITFETRSVRNVLAICSGKTPF